MAKVQVDMIDTDMLTRAVVYAHEQVEKPGAEKWRDPPYSGQLAGMIRDFYCRWMGTHEFPFVDWFCVKQFVRYRKLSPADKTAEKERLNMAMYLTEPNDD